MRAAKSFWAAAKKRALISAARGDTGGKWKFDISIDCCFVGTLALLASLPAGASPRALPGVFAGIIGGGGPNREKPNPPGCIRPPHPPACAFSYARSPLLIRLINVGVSPS